MSNAPIQVVRHSMAALVLIAAGAMCLPATTLERLSLDDMVAQSTVIVRGKVTSASAVLHAPVIYTHYKVQVTERYKGDTDTTVEFIVPGGTLDGTRQDVAGAPPINLGQQYVLFLWKGPSGYAHVIGLTQGVFTLSGDSASDPTAVRNASTELMLDRSTGSAVRDERLTLRLSVLKSRISSALGSLKPGAAK